MEYWTHGRPVLMRPRFYRRDPGQDPPWAWCRGCGLEVWDRGEELCTKCREEKK